MKKIRCIKGLCLAALMVLSLTAFSACGASGETPQSTEAAYRVTVQDALGNPYTDGIAIRFMQGSTQVAMDVVDENGVAEKTITRGDYTVELQITSQDRDYYYDTADLTLTKDKTELTVVLSQALGEEMISLNANGKDNDVYYVLDGCTYVSLNPEGRTYFVFSPQQSGTYEFSLSGSDAPIGYYGESHFIQEHSALEVTDNQFRLSVSEDMLGATPVVGIDGAGENAILCIERIGDAQWSIEQEPWEIYQPTVAISAYTLPSGAVLNKFDITASADTYQLVLNENDGFYHLGSAEGVLVVALIANGQEAPDYTDTFEEIMKNYGPRRIFYDEDGNFMKKEGYVECLQAYIDNTDEAYGVYPLTEDLRYIMEQFGIQQGWHDASNPGYLFRDDDGMDIPGINSEISWLFMCRYL